jgi:hypothetical protein
MGSSSLALNLDNGYLNLCSSALSKARLAQTTLYSSRFHEIEGGLPVFPSVFFASLVAELVGRNRDQTFPKLRNMRGQKSKQRNTTVLSLCLRLMDRRHRRKEDRIELVEGTMLSERKHGSQDSRRQDRDVNNRYKQHHN